MPAPIGGLSGAGAGLPTVRPLGNASREISTRAPVRTARAAPTRTPTQINVAPPIRDAAILSGRQILNRSPGPQGILPPTPSPRLDLPGESVAPQSTVRGDVDGDGRVTNADAKALLAYLFEGAAAPAGLANADVNGDGRVSIVDALKLVTKLNPVPASSKEG